MVSSGSLREVVQKFGVVLSQVRIMKENTSAPVMLSLEEGAVGRSLKSCSVAIAPETRASLRKHRDPDVKAAVGDPSVQLPSKHTLPSARPPLWRAAPKRGGRVSRAS